MSGIRVEVFAFQEAALTRAKGDEAMAPGTIPGISNDTWSQLHGNRDHSSQAILEALQLYRDGRLASTDIVPVVRARSQKRRLDEFRRRKFDAPDWIAAHIVSPDPLSPYEEVQLGEERETVRSAIRGLTPTLAQTAWLSWVEGKEVSEIADTLACPAKTIHDRLNRAKQRLAPVLSQKLFADRN